MLFRDLDFPTELGCWFSQRPNRCYPLDTDLEKLRINGKWQFGKRHYLWGVSAEFLRILGRIGYFPG